jgi:hypothetical protein
MTQSSKQHPAGREAPNVRHGAMTLELGTEDIVLMERYYPDVVTARGDFRPALGAIGLSLYPPEARQLADRGAESSMTCPSRRRWRSFGMAALRLRASRRDARP